MSAPTRAGAVDRHGGPASGVVVVDLSCSGLAVATDERHTLLRPAVAAASVLATADGTDLPPGGDRFECSSRVDALAGHRPEDVLTDPYAWAHRDRVTVSGLSVPVGEMLATPLRRALSWAGVGRGGRAVVLVSSCWGGVRMDRIEAAATRLGVEATAVRAALVAVDALPSSTARWTAVVESGEGDTPVALVERVGRESVFRSGDLVPGLDPWADGLGRDRTARVVAAVRRLREETPGASSGSFEVLVRGPRAEELVDAFDRARMLSFPVPAEGPAVSLARVLAAR